VGGYFTLVNRLMGRCGTAIGDVAVGAGITGGWSLAYVLINRRRWGGMKGLWIIGLAGFNGVVYSSYRLLDADTARRSEV
jgi:hypothetical protein